MDQSHTPDRGAADNHKLTAPAEGPADSLQERKIAPELIRGAVELERTERGLLPHRLPSWARARSGQAEAGPVGSGPRGTGQEAGVDGQLAMAEAQPSGVRLVMRTAATTIELDTLRTRMAYLGAPPRPDGVYDLYVDGELVDGLSVDGGNVLELDMSDGSTQIKQGPVGTLRFTGLAAHSKEVAVWLPHNEITELVALRSDAPIEPARVAGRPTWVHHGSSISHGSNAARPSATWPAVAANVAGAELVNLGYGGSCLLDPFVAQVIADTPADLISVKIGINLVHLDAMRMRVFTAAVHGFLDTIRRGHPGTPLLVISPLHCPIHEDTPGPAGPDLENSDLAAGLIRFRATGDPAEVALGKLTLRTIRTELARIIAQRGVDDRQLHLLDGESLYGPEDYAELPLADELHPSADAHQRIGERFGAAVFADGGAFWQPTMH